MGSIPDDFPLSLRAWPSKDADASDLARLIARINVERGSFRNVTEESLREEIHKSESGDAGESIEEGGIEPEENIEEPDRLKELLAAREEMLVQLEQAHHASGIALDFVSLLLSKEAPVQASLSITPGLREAVGLGTLGLDKLHEPRTTRSQRHDAELVTKGWQLKSLTETVDSILASATKLEQEIEAETKYWQQVVEVDDQGWAVCPLPQEKHTLGVRFGFIESAPAFRSRSIAALRRDRDGAITLDQGLSSSPPKRLRVRIERRGVLTGQMLPPVTAHDDSSLLPSILRARNAIFVDELWQELQREGRQLASHNVHCVGDEIACQLPTGERVILDLVHDSEANCMESGSRSSTDDDAAHVLYIMLHLLLSHAHQQNYKRRCQAPQPISSRPTPYTTYALFRPIIAYLQHRTGWKKAMHVCSLVATCLRFAGLVQDSPQYTWDTNVSASSLPATRSPDGVIEDVFSGFSSEIHVPITTSPQQALNMRLQTSQSPLETLFYVELTGPLQDYCKPLARVSSSQEAQLYIQWAVACAIGLAAFNQHQKGVSTTEEPDNSQPTASSGFIWSQTRNPTLIQARNARGDEIGEAKFTLEVLPSQDILEMSSQAALDEATHVAHIRLRHKRASMQGQSISGDHDDNDMIEHVWTSEPKMLKDNEVSVAVPLYEVLSASGRYASSDQHDMSIVGTNDHSTDITEVIKL